MIIWIRPVRGDGAKLLQLPLLRESISATKVNKLRCLFVGIWYIENNHNDLNKEEKRSMKKVIKKFWGLGLVIIILSTLFIAATPVSAVNPLAWNTEAIPTATGAVLLDGSNVADLAVGPDGTTIYAVCGGTSDNSVYKSTNAGVSWVAITNNAGMSPGTLTITPDLVAVAADDEDVVIIVDVTAEDVRVTTTGGTQWSDLDTAAFTPGTVVGVSVSSEVSGIRYVAVADSAGEVWIRKFGSSWEEWVTAGATYTGYVGVSAALSVAFSPNFASDRTLAAVSDNVDSTNLELLVFTSIPKWNAAAGLMDYPAEILNYTGGSIADPTGASIALAPDYPGGGEVESVAFIGLMSGTTTNAGVYRMDDYISSAVTRSKQIASVAYDGAVCVAGASDARVWRSENPMDTSPTFLGNNSMKGPGGATNALVGFAGTTVVAGTSGDESAFAVSTDNGRSFSDISLIDTAIANISDFAVSPDGTKVYMVTDDGANQISLWRSASSWQRVLSYLTGDNDYIIRVAPDNFDAVYVADTGAGSTKIFRSTAGGDTRWYTRSGPGVADLAVESDNVLYAAVAGTKSVSKSTNGGAYFGDAVDTKLDSATIFSIKCLSEDNIIVGGSTSYVSYSTDGGESWTHINQMIDGPLPTHVTATGLTEGSYIYASTGGGAVFMWTIGQSMTEPWVWVGPIIDLPAGSAVTGMEMFGGTLYASTANGTPVSQVMRNTMPWLPEMGFVFWSGTATVGAGFNSTPSALRLSSTDTYVKIWCAGGTTLYSYMDTLVLVAPEAIAPAEGALIPINVKTNLPYNITFTWTRPSLATSYNLFIALDPFYGESIIQLMGIEGNFRPTQSYTLTGTDLAALTPGTTYYWGVSAAEPLSSGFSAMPGMAFTVQAGEASVPILAAPASGASDVGMSPAFSWSPVTETTMYEFQMSEGTAFAVPMVTEQIATTAIVPNVTLVEGKMYFWRVRALEPVAGDWSAISSFTVAVPEEPAPPPITVTTTPPPQITVTTPAPPPALTFTPPAEETITPAFIWAIIIIGAVLVIAVIILIVRTRRSV